MGRERLLAAKDAEGHSGEARRARDGDHQREERGMLLARRLLVSAGVALSAVLLEVPE